MSYIATCTRSLIATCTGSHTATCTRSHIATCIWSHTATCTRSLPLPSLPLPSPPLPMHVHLPKNSRCPPIPPTLPRIEKIICHRNDPLPSLPSGLTSTLFSPKMAFDWFKFFLFTKEYSRVFRSHFTYRKIRDADLNVHL